MNPADRFPHIIGDLYAGVLDEAAWRRGIIGLTDLIGANGTNLYAVNRTNSRVLRDEGHRIDPALTVAYRDYWSTRDTLIEPFMRIPVGEPATDYQMNPMWRNSELFNELALPFDCPYVIGTILHRSAGKFVALSIKASARHGPFCRHEAERLKTVIPHLQRVLEIKDRLALAQARANAAATCLDSLSFGAIVLDSSGRLLEANAVAVQLMHPDSGIHQNPDGTLSLREPAGTEMNHWIAFGLPPAQNADGLLHVPRPHAHPLSVMVTPLPQIPDLWLGGSTPRWLLLLFDPDRRIKDSTELIAGDLGLSPREAEVAALLVCGYDLAGIASRLSISVHTVRTHLKSIFSRTGIRSQGELMRRIANGPAGLPSVERPSNRNRQ